MSPFPTDSEVAAAPKPWPDAGTAVGVKPFPHKDSIAGLTVPFAAAAAAVDSPPEWREPQGEPELERRRIAADTAGRPEAAEMVAGVSGEDRHIGLVAAGTGRPGLQEPQRDQRDFQWTRRALGSLEPEERRDLRNQSLQ